MAARAGRAGRRDATAPSARCDREFTLKGYYGTSAEAIAKRAGVTQPYLFPLIPGEKAIAALTRSTEDARLAFESMGRRTGAREGLPRHGQPNGDRLHAADLDAPRNASDADAEVRRRSSHRRTGQ
ncbi:TetR family transcriptional regulator [Streptomyces sp. NBC_00286]|uniref:TetR family transcriptional regulator n=1 Tax=Streptomyces sp. NBC_00286 TaxID=2975701 RepID=UPI003FA73BA5